MLVFITELINELKLKVMKSLKVKTIALIVVMGLISYNSMAQKATEMVPQAVLTAFSVKYPQEQLKNWKTKNNMYIASFAMANEKYKASFSNDGSWLSTETKIRKKANLPLQVQAYLKKSDYASWYVERMEKVQTPLQNMYQVQIDNNSGNPTSYSNAGALENKMLSFNRDGKLLKVVNN